MPTEVSVETRAGQPVAMASGCAVCGSLAPSEAWKQGNLPRDLRPEDFHITDARYGVTLPLARCRSCGFIHAPEANGSEILHLYEQMEDPEYDASGFTRLLQMEWILRLARKHHPQAVTLLDIGAGTGMLVAEAQKQAFQAQGVEPSFALSGLALERGLPVVQGVYPHPDLAGRQYDVVCLVDVIEHVERPNELLRDAASALAPGGLLIVITPDISSIAARLLGKRWWHLRLAHIGYFTPKTFGQLATRCGLQIASTLRAQWFFPLSYLAERVEVYMPWIRPLNRIMKGIPVLRNVYQWVIPVNLHDSSVFLLSAKEAARGAAIRSEQLDAGSVLRALQDSAKEAAHGAGISPDTLDAGSVLRGLQESARTHSLNPVVPADATAQPLLLGERIKAHISIARPDHLIKNVFALPGILIPVSLAPQLLTWQTAGMVATGMTALGFIACSNYVINELLDAPFDRHHPVKRNRPAAMGLISAPLAYAQWILMGIVGLGLGLAVSKTLAVMLGILWAMGWVYNIQPLRTKDRPWLDVLSEAVNNPLRLLIGWYMVPETGMIAPLSLLTSYWMVGCYFMAAKRFSEYREIGTDCANAYRRSFKFYTERSLLVSIMFYASAAMLFFGGFVVRYRMELVLSFPLIAVVMAIYLHLAFEPNSPVQNPEKLHQSKLLTTATSLCAAVMIALLWLDIPALRDFLRPTLELGGR